MSKATISILRTNGGFTDVTIHTFGDAPIWRNNHYAG